jgi:type IV secretory pathway TraG/TraD family ATPase VirD4
VIFRQDDPDDAELWARFIGTKTVIKRTYQSQDGMKTGASSNRESQEFIVAPDTIKTLGVGECVLSVKTGKVHRKIRLPLPPSFRSKTPTDSTEALSKRIRGRVSHSKTESERIQDLSAENFEINQPKASSKWAALVSQSGDPSS